MVPGNQGCSDSKVSLMFLPLGMGQVAVLIVQQQAVLAFIGSRVFGHKVQDLVNDDGF